MSIELDIVGLLYRADWTRLSMAAEVSITRDPEPSSGGGQSPSGGSLRSWWTGREWEAATDPPRTDTGRSTLLIAPGGRYRQENESFISGCDGNRNWDAQRVDGRWVVGAVDDAHPPLEKLLRPSWLLTGYVLETAEAFTAYGRDAVRVVATPRLTVRERTGSATRPRPLDRVEAIVDTEAGILLRHAEIVDGGTVNLTELENVIFDPATAADDAQFLPPGGWDAVQQKAEPESHGGPSGPVWDAAKVAAGLAVSGLGGILKKRSNVNVFEQATREEPEAGMPADEPAPEDRSAVSDEVLHLLYRSENLWASGLSVTLHQWFDGSGMVSEIPDKLRNIGFGAWGLFLDAAAERMDTVHMVCRARIAGPLTYRIDYEPDTTGRRKTPITVISDGERRWSIHADRATVGPATPPPSNIADLLDSSWLLTHPLSGGSQTTASGRPGFHLHVDTDNKPLVWLSVPEDVVIDAELGVVLRLIARQDARTVRRCELRDVTTGPVEPGDFQPGLPPGFRVTKEYGPTRDASGQPQPYGGSQVVGDLARQAASDAQWAVRGFLDRLRGDGGPDEREER
jgi:hypothetical protein